jgi:hypothetical protein
VKFSEIAYSPPSRQLYVGIGAMLDEDSEKNKEKVMDNHEELEGDKWKHVKPTDSHRKKKDGKMKHIKRLSTMTPTLLRRHPRRAKKNPPPSIVNNKRRLNIILKHLLIILCNTRNLGV